MNTMMKSDTIARRQSVQKAMRKLHRPSPAKQILENVEGKIEDVIFEKTMDFLKMDDSAYLGKHFSRLLRMLRPFLETLKLR